MYAVVGCTDCSSLWVLETGSETATCPRCGRRHQTEKLRHMAEAETSEEAREARSALVAQRRDGDEAAPSFGELSADVADAGVDDEERLEAAGIDPDRVAEAGERATETSGSTSRRETLLRAFEVHDEPTTDELREYASEHGVPASYVDRALPKLVRAGEVTETGDGYRKL